MWGVFMRLAAIALGWIVNSDHVGAVADMHSIPVRESQTMPKHKTWPNYVGAGCVATRDEEAFVVTTTYHYSYNAHHANSYACTRPTRRVEIVRVNTSMKGYYDDHPPPVVLFEGAHCDGPNITVWNNTDLCDRNYPNGRSARSVGSTLIQPGQKFDALNNCQIGASKITTIENSNAQELCAVVSAVVSFVRFMSEPHPAVTGRVIVGGPFHDSILGVDAIGDLGSDDVVACGVTGDILFYVGANRYRCPRSRNTPSSMVRIGASELNFIDRTVFEDDYVPPYAAFDEARATVERTPGSCSDLGYFFSISSAMRYRFLASPAARAAMRALSNARSPSGVSL